MVKYEGLNPANIFDSVEGKDIGKIILMLQSTKVILSDETVQVWNYFGSTQDSPANEQPTLMPFDGRILKHYMYTSVNTRGAGAVGLGIVNLNEVNQASTQLDWDETEAGYRELAHDPILVSKGDRLEEINQISGDGGVGVWRGVFGVIVELDVSELKL